MRIVLTVRREEMRGSVLRRGTLSVFVILLAVSTLAQSDDFVGIWETRKPSATARAAVTVKIVKTANGLSGTVFLADREGGSTRLTFEKSLRVADTLKFETPYDGEVFYWELKSGKHSKSGTLKGAYHEMLIDEPVTLSGTGE